MKLYVEVADCYDDYARNQDAVYVSFIFDNLLEANTFIELCINQGKFCALFRGEE